MCVVVQQQFYNFAAMTKEWQKQLSNNDLNRFTVHKNTQVLANPMN